MHSISCSKPIIEVRAELWIVKDLLRGGRVGTREVNISRIKLCRCQSIVDAMKGPKFYLN